MRYKDTLENLLAQKSKLKILRLLFKGAIERTGREIARSIRMDHKTCHRALRELAQQGVVIVTHTGGGDLYKLNTRNLLVRKILNPLFETEKNLLRTMAKLLVKRLGFPITSIILFGSTAKGLDRPTSDVDVLILIPQSKRKKEAEDRLNQIEFNFIAEFGNMLSPIVLPVSEFSRRYKKGDKLLREILRTGEVIAGKSIEEVRRLGR